MTLEEILQSKWLLSSNEDVKQKRQTSPDNKKFEFFAQVPE